MPFAPQKNGHLALHVDDIEDARAKIEAKGVEFAGDTLARASARWCSSQTPTATTSCCTAATRHTAESGSG